jgi:hypothetical protein
MNTKMRYFNKTSQFYFAMMNNSNQLPTLGTYYTILKEVFTASDCPVFGMPLWLQNIITVLDCIFFILYIYVMAVIMKNFKKLDNPFYLCTISIAASDFIILLMAMRGMTLK